MTKFRILSVWHHDKQPYHIVLHTDVPIHVEDLKKMFQVVCHVNPELDILGLVISYPNAPLIVPLSVISHFPGKVGEHGYGRHCRLITAPHKLISLPPRSTNQQQEDWIQRLEAREEAIPISYEGFERPLTAPPSDKSNGIRRQRPSRIEGQGRPTTATPSDKIQRPRHLATSSSSV